MFSLGTHSKWLHTDGGQSTGGKTDFIKELLLYVSPWENLMSSLEKGGNLVLYKSFHRWLFDIHANITKLKNL